ncbi:MAG: 4-(cytidine 5'-diphospho)-2-C-methyl-D-erythritol kinase [Pseudorhodoplanes sp.]
MPALVEFAPAKINLTLRVGPLRADGYHDLESLVVFARPRDRLALAPGDTLSISAQGPTAGKAGPDADNLVVKAARTLAAAIPGLATGAFALTKRLPVAAGIGGGSSDAAAALRLLARLNGLSRDDPRLLHAARVTGADVPVCVDPRPRVMRGIGERLSAPLALPELPAVLVNPGVSLPTREVFVQLDGARARAGTAVPHFEGSTPQLTQEGALFAYMERNANELEAPAVALRPEVGAVLSELRALPGCRFARMSGSGATCFGIFAREHAAQAARRLRAAQPQWWVRATRLGAG